MAKQNKSWWEGEGENKEYLNSQNIFIYVF